MTDQLEFKAQLTFNSLELPGYKRMSERVINTQVSEINTGWEDVLLPFGALLAAKSNNDERLLNWVKSWADYHLEAGFISNRLPTGIHQMQHSLDKYHGFFLSKYCGEWGAIAVLAELVEAGFPEYIEPAERFADFAIENALRGDDGVILHGHMSELPWVDTLYYSAMPFARLFKASGKQHYADEAVKQCLLHTKHLVNEKTGLFFHEAHFNGTRSNWSWSRGNGWVIMTFADVLEMCPEKTEGYAELLKVYRDLATHILHYQHSSGLWRIVLENQESHLETSGSVMIATGILSGMKNGWIDTVDFNHVIRTIYEVETWINDKGQLMGCQTPAGVGGWELHKLSKMGERTYGDGVYLRLCADLNSFDN